MTDETALQSLRDATDTVPIGDARSVADAASGILGRCFGSGSFDDALLRATFALVERLFAGAHPGYLACDMPYHDLRHSLDTALVVARMVAGHRREHDRGAQALTPEEGLLAVALGLLHDTGYIRKDSEAALCGPQLTADHEERGAELAAAYLERTSLAPHAGHARIILATRLATDLDALFAEFSTAAVTLGQMLGVADLLSQLADRSYLERCAYHLYPELVLAGGNRARAPDGREQPLFRDAFDLLSRTPQFYENVVRRRLDQPFRPVAHLLAVHFDGADPYAAATRTNVDRAARMAASGRWDLLGPEPPTTTRDVAALYHARPSRAG